jgi:hypothetical protein
MRQSTCLTDNGNAQRVQEPSICLPQLSPGTSSRYVLDEGDQTERIRNREELSLEGSEEIGSVWIDRVIPLGNLVMLEGRQLEIKAVTAQKDSLDRSIERIPH